MSYNSYYCGGIGVVVEECSSLSLSLSPRLGQGDFQREVRPCFLYPRTHPDQPTHKHTHTHTLYLYVVTFNFSFRWFYGFLSSEEAARLLEGQSPGTFLLRFSRSRPGIHPHIIPAPFRLVCLLHLRVLCHIGGVHEDADPARAD